MLRIFIIASVLLLGSITAKAQDEKLRVAVFDPTSSSLAIDEGTRDAIRELISSTFVNTGNYNIVERSLLQQVMKEQKMSNTDAFDESQATELGKLVGANKVVLSVVSLVGSRDMLSIKLIDVQTATIDQQKAKVFDANNLLDVVEPLTTELLGGQADYSTIINRPAFSQSETPKTNDIQQVTSITDDVAKSLKPIEGKAIVYIIRSSSLGALIKIGVECDGQNIGATKSKQYLYAILDPGMHTFSSKTETRASLNVTLEAGKIYYINQKIKMGLVVARVGLELMNDSDGRMALYSCNLSSSNIHFNTQ